MYGKELDGEGTQPQISPKKIEVSRTTIPFLIKESSKIYDEPRTVAIKYYVIHCNPRIL